MSGKENDMLVVDWLRATKVLQFVRAFNSGSGFILCLVKKGQKSS